MNRGAPYAEIRLARMIPLPPSRSHSADEPVFERTVIRAVSRLLSIASPTHFFRTTFDLALCSKVNCRRAHDIAFVARAYGGRTICQHTPPRAPIAGVMGAMLTVVDVHHAVKSMMFAVSRRLDARKVEARRRRAGVM